MDSFVSGPYWSESFLSLLSCACLFDALDSAASLNEVFQQTIQEPIVFKTYSAKLTKATAVRIVGRCKGLVEILDTMTPTWPVSTVVSKGVKFVHRSIPEFLQSQLSRLLERLRITEADVLNTMAWMYVMEIRYRKFVTCGAAISTLTVLTFPQE